MQELSELAISCSGDLSLCCRLIIGRSFVHEISLCVVVLFLFVMREEGAVESDPIGA